MVAQEIHLDYEALFLDLIYEGEVDDKSMIDPETTDADLFPQMPLYHGYNFTGMFDADKAMSLENRIVRQYLFDGAIDANFVGFTT